MLLAGSLALPLAARATAAPVRVKALRWSGMGELPGEGETRRLILSTRVEPFVRARSDSYLEDQGPEATRSLIVEPEGAWVEIKGARRALPARQWAHERAQYGLYGYLLDLAAAPPAGRKARLEHRGLPPIDFELDAAGRPTAADYTVPSYSDDGVIAQRFEFEGLVADGGVTWPRRISIWAAGKLSFRLVIDDFSIEPA